MVSSRTFVEQLLPYSKVQSTHSDGDAGVANELRRMRSLHEQAKADAGGVENCGRGGETKCVGQT
jgi:hypothetical protein